jgi:hypothetical protein
MKRNIQIIFSKEALPTLYIDNVFLHSKYYPSKEAETFIAANEKIYKDKATILIYGLGLGYHVKELLKRAGSNCKIYVFEGDEEIFKIAEKLGMLDEIKVDNRVELVTCYSQEFLNKLSYLMTLVEDILIYKISVKILPDKLINLRQVLEGYILAKIGLEKFQLTMEENNNCNTKLSLPGMNEFFNKMKFVGETVIIAAAGPSLDNNMDILRSAKGKFKIFSVGSALKTLMINGIEPDMITIIDCSEIVYKQFIGFENLNVPLCLLNTASRWVVQNYTGPKYIFYNEAGDKTEVTINTGKTVAVATLDIALKGGAKEIIFIGQDLAFIDNKTHTDTFSEMYESANYVPPEGIYKKVLGVDGTQLNTTEGYLYFKQQIEREIEENPKVTFINCSKGARIKGTIEMELTQVMDRG